MRNALSKTLTLFSVAISVHFLAQSGQGQISGIGFLPDGETTSFVEDVSGDGTWVVGSARDAAGDNQAIRWSNAGGLETLLSPSSNSSSARSISRDGSTIAIERSSETFLWQEGSGLTSIGDIGAAEKISGNGEVIVGTQNRLATRWNSVSGQESLGTLISSGGNIIEPLSQALSTSFDGSIVVGSSQTDSTQAGNREAFLWSRATGMVGLGNLDGSSFFNSNAHDVSDDGTVIVGASGRAVDGTPGGGFEAYRWTEEDGMVGLGFLPDATGPVSQAFAVSGDGNVVGGTASGSGAFIWTEEFGMIAVLDLLEQQGNDISEWSFLSSVTSISSDGTIIAGNGFNSSGNQEGFVARIRLNSVPEPCSSAILFSVLGVGCLVRRREK